MRYVATGEWRKTWGAVAMDEAIGSVGTSVDKKTEHEAREDALRRCRKPGAVGCAVRIAYRNQCVALAWSDVPGRPGGLVSGPGIESVRSRAQQECRNNGGGACAIVHSECTDPYFVPY